MKSYVNMPLILIFFCLLFCISKTMAQYSGGNGTEQDPYLIASGNDLFNIGQNPEHWDKFFLQTADITMGHYDDSNLLNMYTPPGTDFFNPFIGAFDGNGFEIRNLSIDQHQSNLGLFGFLLYPAQLLNINLINVDIKGDCCVGALAGTAEANTINCTVSGNISGSSNVGGLIGSNGGRIYNCHSSGNVSGASTAGGICGVNAFYVHELQIIGCGLLDSSYSTAAVSATNYAGGLCGENPEYQSTILNCYALGPVSADYAAAGLCAVNVVGGDISGCYSDNVVTGGSYVAGLVAFNLGSSISNCYSSGSVSGKTCVGGLCALNDSEYISLYDDYWWGWIDCSFSNCDVIVQCNNTVIGGLCADNNSGIICCFAYNDVTVEGNNNTIGGLIGSNEYCVNCYSYGNISVSGDFNSVGGFVNNTNGHLADCYSRETISSSGSNNAIEPFYVFNGNVMETCFWDVDISLMPDPEAGGIDTDGVVGITTALMMDINTFLAAGWDFVGNGQDGHWEMGIFPVTYCQNYIDLFDFSDLAECWLNTQCGLPSDCHYLDLLVDHIVDINDLAILTSYWLSYDPIVRVH